MLLPPQVSVCKAGCAQKNVAPLAPARRKGKPKGLALERAFADGKGKALFVREVQKNRLKTGRTCNIIEILFCE